MYTQIYTFIHIFTQIYTLKYTYSNVSCINGSKHILFLNFYLEGRESFIWFSFPQCPVWIKTKLGIGSSVLLHVSHESSS